MVQVAELPTVFGWPRLKSNGPVQAKPDSTWQTSEQPSPGAVLPSSQPSVPRMSSSPQSPSHRDGEPAQDQPASTAQADEQPSPTVLLPSSQPSVAVTTPSPQVAKHSDASSVTRL